LTKARGDEVLATHRAAQALLKPLAVANPFAEQLTFASDCVRLRRDQQKYLTLIEAITLLHQHQRPIRATAWKGKPIEYIEVTAADIALANRLAHEVLGRSLDELPPQTRRMLGLLTAYVDERARTQGIERSSVRFTRRELRAHIGASEKQTRLHLDRLVELEYLLTHAGRSGQRFRYELLFDGDAGSDEPQAIGLIDVERLGIAGTTAKLVASSSQLVAEKPKLGGRSWPVSGPIVGTSSASETALPARPDANLAAAAANVAESTALTEPASPRLNGASYPKLARS